MVAGRVKLVSGVLVVLAFFVAMFVHMTPESASSKVMVMNSVETQRSILLPVDESDVGEEVVLQLGWHPLVKNQLVGVASLLLFTEISMKLQVASKSQGFRQVFSVNGPLTSVLSLSLPSDTSDLLVQARTLSDELIDVCKDQTGYSAPVGQWLQPKFVLTPTFVEFYINNELKCRREDDFIGHNDVTVWMTSDNMDPAKALVQDFTIKSSAQNAVVLQLEGECSVEANQNKGEVRLLDAYEISFDVKVDGVVSGDMAELFTLDAGEPKFAGYGHQPAVFLKRQSTTFLVLCSTTREVPHNIIEMCEGQTEYSAPIGQWVHVKLVVEAKFSEFYVNGALQCRHEDDDYHSVGPNRDATLWLATDAFPVANAVVKDLIIKTFERNVVLKLEGERSLALSTNAGDVTLLDSYQVSFKLKITSTIPEASELFTLNDGGEPNVDGTGLQSGVYLNPHSNTLIVLWSTRYVPFSELCTTETEYSAPIGEWVDIQLVNSAGFVEFYVSGALQCRADGDFLGRNSDATLWLTSGLYPVADAIIKDLTIKTW